MNESRRRGCRIPPSPSAIRHRAGASSTARHSAPGLSMRPSSSKQRRETIGASCSPAGRSPATRIPTSACPSCRATSSATSLALTSARRTTPDGSSQSVTGSRRATSRCARVGSGSAGPLATGACGAAGTEAGSAGGLAAGATAGGARFAGGASCAGAVACTADAVDGRGADGMAGGGLATMVPVMCATSAGFLSGGACSGHARRTRAWPDREAASAMAPRRRHGSATFEPLSHASAVRQAPRPTHRMHILGPVDYSICCPAIRNGDSRPAGVARCQK